MDLEALAKRVRLGLHKGKRSCRSLEADYRALDRAIKAARRNAHGRELATEVRRQVFSAGRRAACRTMEIHVDPQYKGGRPQWGNHAVRSQRDTLKGLDAKAAKRIALKISRPGALLAKAKRAQQSVCTFARKHYHDKGLTGRQARFYVNVLAKKACSVPKGKPKR